MIRGIDCIVLGHMLQATFFAFVAPTNLGLVVWKTWVIERQIRAT